MWDGEKVTEKVIKDSGNRRAFESGAVRDIQEGKGRCDLLPLEVVSRMLNSRTIRQVADFVRTQNTEFLIASLNAFIYESGFKGLPDLFLEVSKHFEEGAKKYGEYNWQKGIPTQSYIDSAIRHLLKYKAGWDDEPHDRAFAWNIICLIWTLDHKPEDRP